MSERIYFWSLQPRKSDIQLSKNEAWSETALPFLFITIVNLQGFYWRSKMAFHDLVVPYAGRLFSISNQGEPGIGSQAKKVSGLKR